MPPYFLPNNPYSQLEIESAETSLDSGHTIPRDQNSLAMDPSQNTPFLPQSNISVTSLGAGIVAVGIVASVFLFVRRYQTKQINQVQNAKERMQEDLVFKTTKVAPLSRQSLTFPEQYQTERPPPLSNMKRIRSGANVNMHIHEASEVSDCSELYESQSIDDGVQEASPNKRTISLYSINTTEKTSATPPIQMEDVLSTHLSEMEVDVGDVPAITIYRSGEESRPSRNSETSSTQSNALKTNSSLQSNTASRSSQAEEASSVTELLQAALPDKLGEFDFNYKSSHTSTTSVSMLSAKVMRFKVEKPWIPQQDDELSLNIDDIVHVYQVFNDCWCEGFVDGAEDQLGMFPRDCLSEHPLSLWDLANKSDEKITQTDSTEDPGIREVE